MMSATAHPEGLEKKTEIIAFSSGKGGTGKTLIATCLGYALTKIKLKVLMIDADLATDGLSLYLLGPGGMDKVGEIPPSSTLTGILRQYQEQGKFQFKPCMINRGAETEHGVVYDAIISGKQIYGDPSELAQDDTSIQPDQEAYRNVIQTIFDSLRSKAEYDYVLVDTRGGFSSQSTDVSALADSYIVVTEADVTSFYQNRNLIRYIDTAAKELGKQAVLRSIIVNKSTQFKATGNEFDLDNLESSFRVLLTREFPIDYKATHPIPLSLEALTVQKSHKIPVRNAQDSDFSYAFFVAFHEILSAVTQPWTQEQVAGWNYLVESVNLAIQKRNDDLLKAEQEQQEQHKELETLQKDNAEYINRISSLEREIREIDERYKREIQRTEDYSSKAENEKKALQQELNSLKATTLRQRLVSGFFGIVLGGILFFSWLFGLRPAFIADPIVTETMGSIYAALTFEQNNIKTSTPIIEIITSTPPSTPTETPPPTLVPTLTPPACPEEPSQAVSAYHVDLVADLSVPDYTVLSPGQEFTKTWFVRNTGIYDWTSNISIHYTGGGRIENPAETIPILQGAEVVHPGQCIAISVNMRAPTESGRHDGFWIFVDPEGNQFGQGIDPKVPQPITVTIVIP